MPATPNIIDQLGISWTLHVDTIATLYYDHPVFGYLEYTGVDGVPWLCDNTNTLYLTSQGTGEAALPDGVLPKKVCIRPKYSGECGDYDLNTYNPPGDKCLCKDIECDFYLPLFLTCDGVTDNCIGHFIKGDDATECEASGPTYTAQCPLNGTLMEVRIYCKAGTWMADIYDDGTLCDSCVELTIEACPFRITGSYTAETCANDCVPCIGEGCEEPPPPVECSGCSIAPPSTLTCTLSSPGDCAALDGDSFTITYASGLPDISGNTEAWVGTDACGNTWRFWCGTSWPDFNGFTYNSGGDGIAGGTVANCTITEGDCSPFEASGTAAVSPSSTPCCGTAPIGVTITE